MHAHQFLICETCAAVTNLCIDRQRQKRSRQHRNAAAGYHLSRLPPPWFSPVQNTTQQFQTRTFIIYSNVRGNEVL